MSLTERCQQLFLDRPGEWIDGRTLAATCGYAGWRTRISDCRKRYGMVIENQYHTVSQGRYRLTRYRWIPSGKAQ